MNPMDRIPRPRRPRPEDVEVTIVTEGSSPPVAIDEQRRLQAPISLLEAGPSQQSKPRLFVKG